MPPPSTLRWRLREATTEAHARLDARIGSAFETRKGYVAFLQGMHRFLDAAAVAVDGGAAFAEGRQALAADLNALGAEPPPRRSGARCATGALGWRYVVAGSSLGARVLLVRAQALGWAGTDGGARYLAAQAASTEWRCLLAALDASTGDAADAAIAGARDAFACAERCMIQAFETCPA